MYKILASIVKVLVTISLANGGFLRISKLINAQTIQDPILVVVNDAYTTNRYGRYLGEILRAEGLNAYTIMNITAVDATELAQHELVILAQTSLTSSQATMFTNYVNGGGRLLAMRPDAQIAGLFGLGSGAGSLSNGYLKINTTVTVNGQQPGAGLTNSALQIHGQANQYNLQPGAVMLAELYTNTSTGTGYPAVVSSGNGRAMAFTYDLALNVVYTRQGNPANANVDVDGDGVFRTIDLFQTAGDGAPWVNRDLIPVPQADEQQRLFARMVKQMVGEVEPMPQLWYFPGIAKTMLVLTGDAHANPTSYFQNEIDSLAAHGGTATFYLSIGADPSDTSMQAWRSQGFEFGIHPYADKSDPDPAYNITSLTQGYAVYDSWYASTFSSLKSETVRNHQVAWLGWTDAADLEASYGIAMDTDFYHWGPWLQKSDGSWPHGYITGSGQPMKFVRSDGTIIPVYQQLTELVDEQLLGAVAGAGFEDLNGEQTITVSQQMIDASLAGDYAAIMTQNHVDYYGEGDPQVWAEGMLDYASSHGVPVWNADQWLAFTQTRHDASFSNINWDSSVRSLSFQLNSTTGENLTTILPLQYENGPLISVLVDGSNYPFTENVVNGKTVAFVSIPSGNHQIQANYNLSISKSLQSSSLGDTLNLNLTIGEIATFALTISLPEGVISPVNVVDDLPAGMSYVPDSVQVDTSGFGGSVPTPVVTAQSGSGGTVNIDFGSINVTVDGKSTNNSFKIYLDALVLDIDSNIGLVPPGRTSLANSATLQIENGPLDNSNVITTSIVEPRLVVSKTISASQASANDLITTTIQVENTGTSTAYDVILEDPLPATKFSNYTSVNTPAGYVFTTQPSGSTTMVIYSGGSINAGQIQTFQFTAKLTENVTAGEVIADTATVTQATTLPGTDPNERKELPVSSNEASLTVIAPDISLIKTDGVSLATPGQNLVYTLTVTNDGLRDAENVAVSDTLPLGTSFVSASDGGANTNGVVSWGAFNLASGASAVRTLTLQINNPFGAGITEIRNTAQAYDDGAHGTDPTPANNIAEDVDLVQSGVDLQLSKTDGGVAVEPGGEIVYTLSFANTGNKDATGVVITETLPANTNFNVAGSTSGWICMAGNCTYTVGALSGGGGSGSVNFAVSVLNPLPAGVTQINNTAVIGDDGSNGVNSTPGNNTAQDTTPVTTAPDLQLSKTDGGITAVPGGVIVYTLSYANVGNQGATGVVITETLPANTSFNVAGSTSGWTCVAGSCTFSVGSLSGGGGSGSVDFAEGVANPLPAGVTQISNTAVIGDDGSNGADPKPADNTAGETTPVTAVPDLQLSKTDGGIVVEPGGMIVYTLSYANDGNQGATGVVITETLPANTSFNAGGSKSGWNCVASSCSYSVGALNGGGESGSVNFAVTVVDPLPEGVTQISNTAVIGDDGSNGTDPTPGDNTAVLYTRVRSLSQTLVHLPIILK